MRRLLLCIGSALLLGSAAMLGLYWWNARQAEQAQQRAKSWLDQAVIRQNLLA